MSDKRKTPHGFIVYPDLLPSLEAMSKEDAGTLFIGGLRYVEFGEEPELSHDAKILWPQIKSKIDRDRKKYEEVCEERRYAGHKGGSKTHGHKPLSPEAWNERQGKQPLPSDSTSKHLIADDSMSDLTITETETVTETITEAVTETETEATTPLPYQEPEGSIRGGMGEGMPVTRTSDKEGPQTYGKYGWVSLNGEQYKRLSEDLGKAELERCITEVDCYAEKTNNKKGWWNWDDVIRKYHRKTWPPSNYEGWGASQIED